MANEADNTIKERLHSIFPDPKTAQKVVDLVTSNRPRGWGHRSYAPYYKECYGQEIKEVIDKMMVDKNTIIYRYSTFCTPESGMSKQTLYNRVNQSLRYLLECMDPDGIYKRWYDSVLISRDLSVGGIVIKFIPTLPGVDSSMKPELVQPKEHVPKWRRQMEEWLDDETIVKPFVVEKLALSQDEIVELKVQFAQLSNVMASITANAIRLIKINE